MNEPTERDREMGQMAADAGAAKMTAERKNLFWWASVHGADPEPVECVEVDGKSACYTCGCADPFFLTLSGSPVLLISKMDRPKHPKVLRKEKEEAERLAKEHDEAVAKGRKSYIVDGKRYRVVSFSHGWRGPR